MLIATRALVNEIGCAVPVLKKSYVCLVQQLASKVKEAHQESKVDQRELVERDGKIEALSLKVQRLAGGSENSARLQSQVTTKYMEATVARVGALLSAKALDAMTRAHALLQSEVDVLHATREC